jgi:hypothetical protein
VISTAYIKSGHLLPLTADGQKTAFSHSFSHGLKALKGHLLGTCFFFARRRRHHLQRPTALGNSQLLVPGYRLETGAAAMAELAVYRVSRAT